MNSQEEDKYINGRIAIINADKKYIKTFKSAFKMTHYGNGQIVLDNVSEVRGTVGYGGV